MRAAVRTAFIPFTQKFEGTTTWMYLDVKGLVTIGYGNLIDPTVPHCLDFRDRSGHPVSANAVAAEWRRVKASTGMTQMGGYAFANVTSLRATQSSVDALALTVLGGFESVLQGLFPEWDSWPADAQLGALSLAWACGPHLSVTYPRFTQAARAQTWTACAAECHISEVGNPGVRGRNKANVALFLNANFSDVAERLIYSVT